MKTSNGIVVVFLLLLLSCKQEKSTTQKTNVDFTKAQNFYKQQIQQAIISIDSLALYKAQDTFSKLIFKQLRIAFKKAEPYASYLNPEVGHKANGPALPQFTDDTQRVLAPIGLQKIEESIYEGGTSDFDYKEELRLTRGLLNVLKRNINHRDLNPQRFFRATHQQLLRIVSFGLTGFDTPISQQSLYESQVSLESLLYVYQLSLQDYTRKKDDRLDKELVEVFTAAIQYLEQHQNFESFNRFTFLKNYFNPLMRKWVQLRKTLGIWSPKVQDPFNYDAVTFFEEDSFNVDFFRKPSERNPSEKEISLGKKLFFDPKLSTKGTMSCATCHHLDKAYTDGLKTSLDNNGKPSLRNAPTLVNVAFQKSFFLDGRSNTLNDQISLVFQNKSEFDTEIHQFSETILTDSSYVPIFKELYGRVPKKNTKVISAISAYISTLKGFSSKFDKNIRGEEDTFTASEKRGFNLYMGKALCATCHFMPLTNGTVPPFFKETEKEVIGVPKTNANKQLDSDRGFYWVYEEAIHDGMFKTPTVRNIAVTAPYMHNGVYNTLEEVMDFYNQGGGAGLGFNLPHQTLPFDELNLSETEIKDIIAFLHTLTDVPEAY
ncbi:cytochrome-c peroxidase [Ochrovirga pacifica]|uniref:cytochrome-c peroxidase n=1 Tax=Ochrovirga pacifica TaxID=1042376 RepID=UPI0002557B42|nr:cytochrome c peroxidase [Ochrovirga pacifica]